MRRFLLLSVFFLFFPATAHAQPATTPASDTTQAARPGPASPEDVAAFLDPFFAEQMEDLHVPGAVFVMVRDGEIFFKKGYGYADIEARVPVDPDETLFQVASVSKLFTATAVMQMAEQGRVDLHADVNRYLQQVQIEEAFGEPVTLAQLLTHTGGFDERNIGYVARDAASVPPLGAYLAARMPPRMLPPGTVTSYSNHGFGLAGHVVEAVTGEPFARYIDQHIFRPLGMQRSTFETPLPAALTPQLAQGYRWTGETHEAVGLLVRKVPPAGALSTTATDIARFMIAHLQEGRFGEARLLEAATVRAMHAQQFTHHPRLPGMAYGFIEQPINGHRALQHGGDNPGYASLLVLLPGQHTGFFVAANALSNTLRQRLVRQFMDRFYPPPAPAARLQPTAEQRQRVDRFTGAYRLNRYGRRSVENVLTVFQGQYYVFADSAGFLVTQDGERWVEVEPLLFRHEEREHYLAFREDAQGRITHLFRSLGLGGVFPGAYEKERWHESGQFVNEFFLSWIPMILLTWIVWPVGALIGYIRRRWKKRPRPTITAGMRLARWTAALFGFGTLVFAFGFIQKGVVMVQRGGGDLLYGLPAAMATLLWIPLVQVGLAVLLLLFAVHAWRKQYWSLPGRLHYLVFVLAALAWVYFMAHYNVLGRVY